MNKFKVIKQAISKELVDFIYRLGLDEKELREMSVVLWELSESIYENGRERGQQEGWEEGHREGFPVTIHQHTHRF